MLHPIGKGKHSKYPCGVIVFHGRIVRVPVDTCREWALHRYATVEALWDDTEPDIFYLRFHVGDAGSAALSPCGVTSRTFSMVELRKHFGKAMPNGKRVAVRGVYESDGFYRFNVRDIVK
ncbi:MAG: hypothetical protein M0R22_00890 [Dehalococcoidia bacterium]|jgi:hypothetical protein|nr:hypothetical protein [Dehalococcoidia bacterium]